MKKRSILLATLLVVLCGNIVAQDVEPTWESLNKRGYPQWFAEARLGIFVHWGLYSVPAYAGREGYGEWFYRGLMAGDRGRRRMMSLYTDTTLPVREQYAALTGYWHAELWRPEEWARMFKDAGAKYVMFVTKHHDGYCLWDSPLCPEWNSVTSGPRRNIVGELTEAVRGEGLRMCFYYSLPEWSNSLHVWMEDPDDSIGTYVEEYMIPQFKELVQRYKPDAIFSDGDWQNTAEQFHAKELISWYYNTVGPDAIVNDRWGKGTEHGFRTPEYSAGIKRGDVPWAECRGIGRSFGYNRNEDVANFLSDRELIKHFCELVANGGGLTLNVGPMADGTIPYLQQERLRNLGNWLRVNGEAIYGIEPDGDGDFPEGVYARHEAQMPATEAIAYDWVRNAPLRGMPVDNFEVHWNASVVAPADGMYTLVAEGNDEIVVVRDGKDTILYFNSAWAENGKGRYSTKLAKGESMTLDVYYREKDLEATASLKWCVDGGDLTPIAAQWDGVAKWEETVCNFTRRGNDLYVIEYQRPRSSYSIPLDIRLPKGTAISMLGTTGLLGWKQDKKSGVVTVDLSGIDDGELEALDNAWVLKIENYRGK